MCVVRFVFLRICDHCNEYGQQQSFFLGGLQNTNKDIKANQETEEITKPINNDNINKNEKNEDTMKYNEQNNDKNIENDNFIESLENVSIFANNGKLLNAKQQQSTKNWTFLPGYTIYDYSFQRERGKILHPPFI